MTMPPLVFEPWLRPQIWGGRALAERLGKRLPDARPYGESWELSGHPLHVSRTADGVSLDFLWSERRQDLIGPCQSARLDARESAGFPTGFPWLIKFLDCRELLSVQVHPNDRQARRLLGQESGKTEAWVVLASEPAGRIYAGLRPGVTPADVERHLAAGTIDACLHEFAPQTGDCVFIPAGTVHAVGGGVLMAEVQQTSDATFRLFDWNRVGPDGKPRALHREQSLACIDFARGPVSPIRSAGSGRGAVQRLVECDYFQLSRVELGAGERFDAVEAAQGELAAWIVFDGRATLHAEPVPVGYTAGSTVLIPAACRSAAWEGPAVLLHVGP